MEDKLLYRNEVYAIQGAVFDVYKEMGNAWHEEVYQQCLERELADREIPLSVTRCSFSEQHLQTRFADCRGR